MVGGEGAEELLWGLVGESLVGADMVVPVLPAAKVDRERGHGGIRRGVVVELLAVGAIGPFHAAVELGTAWWEQEELDGGVTHALFEDVHDLGAAIDLDGSYGEGHAFADGRQGSPGRGGGSIAGKQGKDRKSVV